jgi:hypothetical protein
MDQNELMASYQKALSELQEVDPRAAAFPGWVARLSELLPLAGAGIILALVVAWVAGGRLVPSHELSASLPPWGLWDALKLGALFTVGAALFRGIFPTSLASPFSSPGDWLAELFSRALLAGVMIHIVVAERGGGLADLGFQRRRLARGIAWGAVGFLAVQPVLHAVELLQRKWISPMPVQEPLQGILTARLPATVMLASFVAVIVAPVTEEMFFRAFLQPALQRWVGRAPGILVATAFFAAGHMDMYNLAPLFVLGLALGYLYDRTGSLAAPVALHVVHNGVTMLAIVAYRGLVYTPTG